MTRKMGLKALRFSWHMDSTVKRKQGSVMFGEILPPIDQLVLPLNLLLPMMTKAIMSDEAKVVSLSERTLPEAS